MFIIVDQFANDSLLTLHILSFSWYLPIRILISLLPVFDMWICTYESQLFVDSTINRLAEEEDNALLSWAWTTTNDNTSYLYRFDPIITADQDDLLSSVAELNVVNPTVDLLLWVENVRRGYRHAASNRLQVRSIQS